MPRRILYVLVIGEAVRRYERFFAVLSMTELERCFYGFIAGRGAFCPMGAVTGFLLHFSAKMDRIKISDNVYAEYRRGLRYGIFG